ncbi:MAG: PLDc N-terminal domain-containing protein [Clostridia bacterium]|nr:PLDc N-terminal domain-containing protein [Clostridia bacterium]
MDELMEMLPFLIPLIFSELALMGFSLYHVLTHEKYRHGNRLLWVLLSFVSFIGPILYFLLGREET